jgi:hypothetical protein
MAPSPQKAKVKSQPSRHSLVGSRYHAVGRWQVTLTKRQCRVKCGRYVTLWGCRRLRGIGVGWLLDVPSFPLTLSFTLPILERKLAYLPVVYAIHFAAPLPDHDVRIPALWLDVQMHLVRSRLLRARRIEIAQVKSNQLIVSMSKSRRFRDRDRVYTVSQFPVTRLLGFQADR